MDRNSILISLAAEISPSYAMKINNVNIDDQLWADNLQESAGLFPSSPMRGIMSSTVSKSSSNGEHITMESVSSCANTLSTEYYNFNFRMGAPIAGKDFDLTPTYSHG
ncbi:hypothetical protein DFA_11222 [Cavenderia fasciculata]|uniref:Uncharacterized protein n=1 Tax=Cavenderia fasciculata TaxID=261658 RepID=F4QFK8_CACFS|nr:uncharacterized protein DFA_11222 [Cavenderia fasciculata]EGG13461.1 hypothetical protein DFA_11222 [Cavenderia fasciculata]|eukprot:XP_004350165.1 hypothetical protein DFA_11222 [Cavenderia fasciculata]